jgi:hypothetical protein
MLEHEQGASAIAEPDARTMLGGSIHFWTSEEGQALIESFGNWNGSTALSCWLAQTYPRFYGADAGLNNLWGSDNARVAAFAYSLEMLHGPSSPECQTLAAALNLYARDPSLHI